MDGKVTALYDLSGIAIPEEMLKTDVDACAVDERVKSLSISCAKAVDVSAADLGDVVHCTADSVSYPDGRTLLLFTGTMISGAEEAAKAAVGSKIGDRLTVNINGKKAELTVLRIVRRIPVTVDDALIASLGISGVITVDDYRTYVLRQMQNDKRMENRKKITRRILDIMIDRSVFEYDEKEMDSEIERNMDAVLAEYAADGLEVTPEEIRESSIFQAKQVWLAIAICKKYGISIDTAAIEDQVNQMIEVMKLTGEEVPSREELFETFGEGEYINGMFTVINRFIDEKTEGKNGSN